MVPNNVKIEMMMLFKTYHDMTGDDPTHDWEQWVYDTLVHRLIQHGPALLRAEVLVSDIPVIEVNPCAELVDELDPPECYSGCDDPRCPYTH